MSFRFLHLADLHLETCFGGRPRTRERLREATLDAFDRALEFARSEKLHAVLVAGDLFDDSILSPRVQWRIADGVRHLARSGCWFLYCCGNHDPGHSRRRAARLGLDAGDTAEPWQSRVHVFRSSTPEIVEVTDADGEPVGRVVGAGHVTDHESVNLCAKFPLPAELEARSGGGPVVGLLHTQVEGARRAVEHAKYAPSFREDYERRPFAYWALGHVHVRQQAFDGLPVWYSGNLQGRNPRETGAKGGFLVEAREGVPAEPEFRSFDAVRWERIELSDLAEIVSVDGMVRRVAAAVREACDDAGEYAARVVLRGPSPLAGDLRVPDELEQVGEEITVKAGALEVQLRLDGLHLPIDLDSVRRSPTVVARAFDVIEAARSDSELLGRLAPDPLAWEDASNRSDYLASLLEGTEGELLERLAIPEDGE